MSSFTYSTKINKTPKGFLSNRAVLIQIIPGKKLINTGQQPGFRNILLTESLFCEQLGLVGAELIIQDLDRRRQRDGLFLVSAKHMAFQNAQTRLLAIAVLLLQVKLAHVSSRIKDNLLMSRPSNLLSCFPFLENIQHKFQLFHHLHTFLHLFLHPNIF